MMSFSVSRRALRPLVKSTVSISKPTDDRPILRNLLLVATDDALEVSATNMIVSLWFRIPVGEDLEVTKSGKVAVKSVDLLRILETAICDRLEIEGRYNKCLVEGPGAKFGLLVEDARDFPKIFRFSDKKPFVTIKTGRLSAMLDRTVYCANDERSAFLMHGVLFSVDNERLKLVATNGQRLAVCSSPIEESSEEFEDEIVIPAKDAISLKKIFGKDKDAYIDIQWSNRSLNIRGPLGEVCVRALPGKFPDYKRGVPNNSKKIAISREKLIRLMSQALVFKTAATALARMDITPQQLALTTLMPDTGKARLTYELEWEHDPMTIVVNPEFLLATAKVMRGEYVDFELEGEMVQTLLRERREDDLESFCVYAVARL